MRPESAVMELTRLGFRFRLDGEAVKVRWEGKEKPDPAQVVPLLHLVKAHKEEVRQLMAVQRPSPPERILTCADCGFHEYQGPNPAHGWGRCTFKEKGCYGLRPACGDVKA
jgi:hypothetical protein